MERSQESSSGAQSATGRPSERTTSPLYAIHSSQCLLRPSHPGSAFGARFVLKLEGGFVAGGLRRSARASVRAPRAPWHCAPDGNALISETLRPAPARSSPRLSG